MAKFIAVLIVFHFLFTTQFSSTKELINPSDPIHKKGREGSLSIGECLAACKFRCSATSHKSACLMYCNQCCKKCLCVPSGTYDNNGECPCYNNLKTKQGGPNCP
ncbi:gibberellin-regulated protein 12 [Eutrema salsugineum]|uniref:gibberellin-regulated protein 12 n=1 Tax=Eutrema salsugineum TaxID=72664 RepID=UPI000CED7D50|nr:gibberellin-regulated protein 12 [Eutrema salsugineum]